ncbi:ATP-binding protein [Aestuariivivens insulae]|uniref:ATP-binding protein n=1 Tax=Aestuariivivens insulae TaxID=1621988 RepID=UPI001F589011|nr:tetratricopeptide repeat-containing sensor histidine kinase [Aestuariivivens insulae]
MANRINSIVVLLIILLVSSCTSKVKPIEGVQSIKEMDSIYYLIDQSKTLQDVNKQNEYLLKAYHNSRILEDDSLKSKALSKITIEALRIRSFDLFKIANKDRFQIVLQLKDSMGIGECYWRYGNFYLATEDLDSTYYAYHEANKIFEDIEYDYGSGSMLYGMAIIKQDLRDYTGSEILAFQAIKKLKSLKKNTTLYLCYHLLGANFYDLKEYEKALFYHEKAIEYLKSLKYKSNYKELSLNSIGLVYLQMKNYNLAINSFKEALENHDLRKTDTRFYTAVLDNLTYSRFLNGETLNIEEKFNEALKIRDSIHYVSGVVISDLRLAEYYGVKGDTTKAISYAKEAGRLAKTVNNHRDRLAALKLLSQLDRSHTTGYLEAYVSLSDSLQAQDRAIRNKFTRIEYETDEYIEETKRLTTQNILISVIGGIAFLVLILLYFIRQQRAKNKELLFEQEQQKANEEIFALMLKQQAKLDEGRTEERHRISEELHDGVLGKLFGTRVGLGYLALSGEDNDVKDYKSYIGELQTIEKEIRDISHALKDHVLSAESGFITVIEDYVGNLAKIHKFGYRIDNDEQISWDAIDYKLKVTLYRIIQEAVQNVVKHAKANNIAIAFSLSQDTLQLKIEDDGEGFDNKKSKKGIGIKNMESRILKHNGKLQVNSKIGSGTTLTVTVLI